jgi:hypothetical protein
MTRLRIGVAGGIAALALVYAVVIAGTLLLGVLAAGFVLQLFESLLSKLFESVLVGVATHR